MKKELLVVALIALSACSRNPDPEYAPDADDDAPAAVTAPAPAAEAPAPPAAVAPAPRLSDDEAYRLGREATAMLFANDTEGLFARFDANVKGQIGTAENWGTMVDQVLGQTGAEGSMVEEAIESDPANPGLAIYRRRGNYLATYGAARVNVETAAEWLYSGKRRGVEQSGSSPGS